MKKTKRDFELLGGGSKLWAVEGRKYMVNKVYLLMQIRVSQVIGVVFGSSFSASSGSQLPLARNYAYAKSAYFGVVYSGTL